jgi:hypothetical protein
VREDLLDAQASIDWAVAHFESFNQRLNLWRHENTEITVVDPGPHIPYKELLAGQKAPLPRFFNVEAGAYINSIRSSLDILATLHSPIATA